MQSWHSGIKASFEDNTLFEKAININYNSINNFFADLKNVLNGLEIIDQTIISIITT